MKPREARWKFGRKPSQSVSLGDSIKSSFKLTYGAVLRKHTKRQEGTKIIFILCFELMCNAIA